MPDKCDICGEDLRQTYSLFTAYSPLRCKNGHLKSFYDHIIDKLMPIQSLPSGALGIIYKKNDLP